MQPKGTLISRTNGVPLFTYKEEGFRPIERYRLDDTEYGHVLQSKVPANTDVVLLNSQKRTFYLAWRKAKPMTGWFWMGGNTGDINAPLVEGLLAVIRRELGLDLSADRLTLRFPGEYFWKDRSQEPRDMGCHMCGLVFSVEAAEDEVAQIKLDPNEYEGGLREFNREDMVREGLFPALIDAYDTIFPPEVLHYVVLISFKEGTPESTIQDIYDRYQTLSDDCGGKDTGILFWRVKRNLDLRKNVHLVEIVTFTDNEALQRFRVHPKHKEIANALSRVADWQAIEI